MYMYLQTTAISLPNYSIFFRTSNIFPDNACPSLKVQCTLANFHWRRMTHVMISLTMYVAFLHVFIHPTYNDILWEYKRHWTQWVGIRLRHQLQNAGCCQGTRCFCPWGHLRSYIFWQSHLHSNTHIQDIRVYAIWRLHTSTRIGHIKQSDSSRCMTRYGVWPASFLLLHLLQGIMITWAVTWLTLFCWMRETIAKLPCAAPYPNMTTKNGTDSLPVLHTNTHTNEHTKKHTYIRTYMNVMCMTHVWIACIYTYQESIYNMTWICMHNHKVHICTNASYFGWQIVCL